MSANTQAAAQNLNANGLTANEQKVVDQLAADVAAPARPLTQEELKVVSEYIQSGKMEADVKRRVRNQAIKRYGKYGAIGGVVGLAAYGIYRLTRG